MMSNNSITPHLSHYIDRKKYNIYILNVYIYIYINYIMGFVRGISPQTSLHQLNLYMPKW